MSFSNKKEDVMYLDLTPYGRQLLSRGELKPEYYAFFDDDMLYDIGTVYDGSNYLSESNGATKERILNDTQYLKVQANFTNREDMVVAKQNIYLHEDIGSLESSEKLNFLNYPLGTSNHHSGQDTPYWNISFLHGTASSATKTLSSLHRLSASLPYKNIPQVEFNVNYKMSVRNIYSEDEILENINPVSPNLQITNPASDGTYVFLQESQLLLYLIEENAFRFSDAFDIEVFLYDEADDNNLVPLKFRRASEFATSSVLNDMLLDQPDIQFVDNDLDRPMEYEEIQEQRFVEYYFDFRVDKEIPEEDICNGVYNLKRKEIFVDLDVDCIERDEAQDVNIYTTRVTDIEEC